MVENLKTRGWSGRLQYRIFLFKQSQAHDSLPSQRALKVKLDNYHEPGMSVLWLYCGRNNCNRIEDELATCTE